MDKIEQLKTAVEMWIWDVNPCNRRRAMVAYIGSNGRCLTVDGASYANCVIIKEPTYRPYTKDDDVSELLGMKIRNKESGNSYIITGVRKRAQHNIESVFFAGNWTSFNFLFECNTKLDGTPIGVLVA